MQASPEALTFSLCALMIERTTWLTQLTPDCFLFLT
jgi:hypothetical protein